MPPWTGVRRSLIMSCLSPACCSGSQPESDLNRSAVLESESCILESCVVQSCITQSCIHNVPGQAFMHSSVFLSHLHLCGTQNSLLGHLGPFQSHIETLRGKTGKNTPRILPASQSTRHFITPLKSLPCKHTICCMTPLILHRLPSDRAIPSCVYTTLIRPLSIPPGFKAWAPLCQ